MKKNEDDLKNKQKDEDDLKKNSIGCDIIVN
jgi:hypothetical protein